MHVCFTMCVCACFTVCVHVRVRVRACLSVYVNLKRENEKEKEITRNRNNERKKKENEIIREPERGQEKKTRDDRRKIISESAHKPTIPSERVHVSTPMRMRPACTHHRHIRVHVHICPQEKGLVYMRRKYRRREAMNLNRGLASLYLSSNSPDTLFLFLSFLLYSFACFPSLFICFFPFYYCFVFLSL